MIQHINYYYSVIPHIADVERFNKVKKEYAAFKTENGEILKVIRMNGATIGDEKFFRMVDIATVFYELMKKKDLSKFIGSCIK